MNESCVPLLVTVAIPNRFTADGPLPTERTIGPIAEVGVQANCVAEIVTPPPSATGETIIAFTLKFTADVVELVDAVPTSGMSTEPIATSPLAVMLACVKAPNEVPET